MIHIEFLLEEPSAEAALQVLVPKIIPFSATFAGHVMGGKKTLNWRKRSRHICFAPFPKQLSNWRRY